MKVKVRRKSCCPLCKEGVCSQSQINNKLDTLSVAFKGLAEDIVKHYERIRECIYHLENQKGV